MNVLLTLALLACGPKGALADAEALVEAGRLSAAARLLDDALDERPGQPELSLALARVRLSLGDAEAAVPLARAATDHGAIGSRAVLSEALSWSGDAAGALRAVEAGPEDPSAAVATRQSEALALVGLGRGQEALPLLASQPSEHLQARALEAWVLARVGRVDEAAAVAGRLESRARDDAEALVDCAVVHYLAANGAAAGQAIEQARVAAAAAGTSLEELRRSHIERADRLHQRGAHELAVRLGMRAVAMDPTDGRLAWAVGTWWLQAGEPRRAADLLTRAMASPDLTVEQRPGAIQVESTVGATREERLQARHAAAVALAEAWARIGDEEQRVAALGIAATAGGTPEDVLRYAQALWDAGRVVEVWRVASAPDPARVGPQLGARLQLLASMAALRLGDMQSALQTGQVAWNLSPHDPEITAHLAHAYATAGQQDRALGLLQAALRAHPGNPQLTGAVDELR